MCLYLFPLYLVTLPCQNSGVSHGVTFNLIPNRMEFCHGQISIETATYSYSVLILAFKLCFIRLNSDGLIQTFCLEILSCYSQKRMKNAYALKTPHIVIFFNHISDSLPWQLLSSLPSLSSWRQSIIEMSIKASTGAK